MKTPKWSRLPTDEELDGFSGMHCREMYRNAVRSGWRCPSCNRTARELVRWSEIRGITWRARYGDEYGMGFTIAMAKHHCHGIGRFAETVICGECNSADGAAKRKLGLSPSWSFSPQEISRFVRVTPHSGKTVIDYDMARAIYDALGGNG